MMERPKEKERVTLDEACDVLMRALMACDRTDESKRQILRALVKSNPTFALHLATSCELGMPSRETHPEFFSNCA